MTAEEVCDLAGVEVERGGRARGVRQLAGHLGLPPAPPAVLVHRDASYWDFDEVLSWLAPALARRGDVRADAMARYRAGATVAEAADAVGVERQALYGWLRRAGALRPGADPQRRGRPRLQRGERLTAALDAYAAGASSRQAARLAGMSAEDFRVKVREAGREVRPQGRPVGWRQDPPERRREGAALVAAGHPVGAVARVFNVSRTTVARWVADAEAERDGGAG